MAITRVWIEEGCISCSLCMDVCGDVFLVQDGAECVIRPEAAEHYVARDEDIRLAAADCPVDVIRVGEDETSEAREGEAARVDRR